MEASERGEHPLPGRCKDWRAQQPQGAGRIMVRGWCTFPTSGWSMELRRKEPQGVNSRDLLLERIVTLAEGYQAQVVKAIEAQYVEETDAEYDTVTILPDGGTIPVERNP
ncbi:MAG TPA: hypothetical protein VM299_02860 [Solirubrobacteraceae bacterium]|nr:hypothetical protein [Solirubrobacteraceae bacterium]